MPITDTSPQNPYTALAGQTNPTQNTPFAGLTPPPAFTSKTVDPSLVNNPNPSSINTILNQAPTSLSSTILPYLMQLYGISAGTTQQMFQQQGAQGAAQAQSDAMKRGLTGSSIEGANIGAAYNNANQGYNQYIAQMLGQLGNQTMNAYQFDIGQQNTMYQSLAQALGQEYSANVSQLNFNNQLQASLGEADKNRNSQLWGDLASSTPKSLSFSDIRLKDDIKKVGEWDGLNIYSFKFKEGFNLDLPRSRQIGFLAHEVAKKYPECVGLDRGFLTINYHKLAVPGEANA